MTRRLPQVAKDAGKALRTLRLIRASLSRLEVLDPYLTKMMETEIGVSSEQFHKLLGDLENDLKVVRERTSKPRRPQ